LYKNDAINESYPLYELYYQPTRKLLITAQQQGMTIGCNYIFSRARKPVKDEYFIGKLRGNFSKS
jgi:hypothetical protein